MQADFFSGGLNLTHDDHGTVRVLILGCIKLCLHGYLISLCLCVMVIISLTSAALESPDLLLSYPAICNINSITLIY